VFFEEKTGLILKNEDDMKSILFFCAFLIVLHDIDGLAIEPPYPQSPLIDSIVWDTSTLLRKANGSDNWATTWGADDNMYATWGDGGGFSSPDAGLGVARMEGAPENFTGTDLWSVPRGYTGGKSYGIISIDDVLYMWVGPNSGWTGETETWLMWSNDRGVSWQSSSVFFTYDDGFSSPTFLNFGKDYNNARDSFVYTYAHDASGGENAPYTKINLSRVPKNKLTDRNSYEFFQGFDSDNNPIWTSDISNRGPIFVDAGGGVFFPSVSYNNAIGRYLMVVTHKNGNPGGWGANTGGLGVFDAPDPWGPWTTVEYTENWMGSTNMFFANIPTKWISSDGLTFWMVFTGYGSDAIAKDAYQHIKGVFTLAASSDTTAPTAPTSLNATASSNSKIDLSWSTASDPESGINSYKIYRDNTFIGSSSGTSYSDTGLVEGTAYTYEVSAVNGTGLEGPKSASASTNTVADTTPPTLASASASSGSSVVVVFSEAIEDISAENPANYAIDNGISISGASLGGDLKTVTLVTSAHTEGSNYQLTVNNVKDRGTTPNTIATNSTANYNFASSFTISNLSVTSGKIYEVMQNALDNGTLVYIDRTYAFSDASSGLVGATYIKTANDDKGSTGNGFLTFDVNQDVAVYIAYDNRATSKPAWLSGFANTGLSVTIASRKHSLWREDFSAGNVALGGNAFSSGSMYSVILFPLSSAPTGDTTAPDPPTGVNAD